MRTVVAQLEANADQCRVRASEIRKLALTVVSENLRDDYLQMSREWETLAKRAGERKWRPLL